MYNSWCRYDPSLPAIMFPFSAFFFSFLAASLEKNYLLDSKFILFSFELTLEMSLNVFFKWHCELNITRDAFTIFAKWPIPRINSGPLAPEARIIPLDQMPNCVCTNLWAAFKIFSFAAGNIGSECMGDQHSVVSLLMQFSMI
ncbi:hypothetical protein ACOSP7_005012 [Xanthoceras sorbifolium]